MTAIRLDGRAVASENEQWLKTRITELKDAPNGRAPCLATILVGDHKPSRVYVKIKQQACERVGIRSISLELPTELTTDALIEIIGKLNDRSDCDGILLQHPVPRHIDELICFDAIDPQKDVDGVSSLGFGRLARKMPAYACATPRGIERLLCAYQIDIAGLDAVIVGRGPILGTPMASILIQADATVTVCHSRTHDLRKHIGRAQLLVAGIGKSRFISSDWIADGAVVVDAGYNDDGSGDVDIDNSLIARCHAYTPVPGGVGPMTVNTLLYQTYLSAHRRLTGQDAPSEPARYESAQRVMPD